MVDSEVQRAGAAARAEDTLEVGRLDETRHRRGRGLAPGHTTARGGASDGQTLATLGAPGVDDGAAATRFHADEKAVRARAAGLGGLVSAFHGDFQGREHALRGEPAITSRTGRPVNVAANEVNARTPCAPVRVFTVDK